MNDKPKKFEPTASSLCYSQISGDRWRDALSERFPGISMDWLDQSAPGRVGVGVFSDALVLEIACNAPVHVFCDRSIGSDDAYELVQLRSGKCRCRHAGQDVMWEAEDLMLFDGTQSFDLTHPSEYQIMIWKLPRKLIAPMLAAPEGCVGHRIPGGVGTGAILGKFLRSLASQSSQLNASAQRNLLMHLCGLVALTLGSSQEARQSRRVTRRAVRRQQILAYVETHLRDPKLTAQRTACDLRMSPRWLHALLAEAELSFAAWVCQRRLEECHKLLVDSTYDHLTVADIAFSCGFASLSSFNRRFRAQFGLAPRDLRRLAAEAKTC